jgi:hypothetical protein
VFAVCQLTLEDRLQAVGSDKPKQGRRLPKADQLVVQLTQGLQSKDTQLLTVRHFSSSLCHFSFPSIASSSE